MKRCSGVLTAILGLCLAGSAIAAPAATAPPVVDVTGAQIRAMLASAPPRSIDRNQQRPEIALRAAWPRKDACKLTEIGAPFVLM